MEWLPLLALSVLFRGVAPSASVRSLYNDFQKSKPPDSHYRIAAALVRESTRRHPRFGSAMSEGEAHLRGNRLWQSRYLGGSFEVTNKGLRWEPKDVNAAVGFRPFLITWDEIDRLVVYRLVTFQGLDEASVWLEGGFGPRLDLKISYFGEARRHLEARGVRIVDQRRRP